MRKTLKVIGIFLAAIVLLIVVLAVALPLFVDPNDFKPRIEAAVKDATGRELKISGDMELSVFPWLGVDLGAVQFANAPGFGDEPFATLESAQVRVKLLPLISREIEIGKVIVEEPVIRLQRNAEGVSNWDDLAGETTEEQPEQPTDEAAPPEFSVDGVELRNAHVLYRDAAAGVDAELTNFTLQAGALGLPASFPLAMEGKLEVSEPQFAATFRFEGHVSADPGQEQYSVAEGQLVLDAEGKALPVSPIDGSLEWANIAADLAKDSAVVDSLQVTMLGAQAAANVEAASISNTPQATGRLEFRAEDIARLAQQLGDLLPEGLNLSGPANGQLAFRYSQGDDSAAIKDARIEAAGAVLELAADVSSLAAPKASGNASVVIDDLRATTQQLGTLAPDGLALDGPARTQLSFSYDGKAGTAQLPEFTAQVLGIDLQASASAKNLNESANISGQLKTGEFSPGRLLVKLGQELPATRDGNVLELASLSTQFSGTPNSVALRDLALRLDQSKLTGSLTVADIEKQALRFNLALDEIDADRYLPPADEQAAEKAGAETPLDEIEIPAELVRGLDINGQLAIGKLKAFDFNSSDVKIGVKAQNDVLRLHPLEAHFYDGGYRGDMRLDASKQVPRVSLDEHVERVQLAPLVKDVLQVENLSGTAKMDITAKARGKTLGDLRKTLGGDFAVDVRDGAIEGFNLWESIRQAYAALKGRSYDGGDAPDRTEFAELSATGKINKGVLENNDLQAKLPFLRVSGAGQVNIAEATLDYRLETRVLKSPELNGGIEELTGTTIPVRLTGPVMDPKVRPDVKGVLEQKAKEALERKEQELRDEAKRKADEEKERLEDKLKDKFKDFFE